MNKEFKNMFLVGIGQEINKFIDESEVNAVFKATEWVIQEIKNKGNLNEM